MYLQPPIVLQRLFPDINWNIRDSGKSLYLTFDDGPNPGTTPEVLGILKKYNAKATFFCLGERAVQFPGLMEAIRKNGHGIGNHGFLHLDGWKTNKTKYIKNAERADKHTSSRLYRPPFGRLSFAQFHALKKKYRIVMWNVMSYDFKAPTIESCTRIVTRRTNNGSVIVFHDVEKTKNIMLRTLENTLMHFQEHGFQFKAIGN